MQLAESGATNVTNAANAATTPRARETEVRFEEIRLPVGESLQLQWLAGEQTTRHYARLIGYVKGQSVLVTAPTVNGKMVLMREGQAVLVRLFSGKSIYAFATSVLKATNVPHPYVHLAYPPQVKTQVVRRAPRVDVQLIAAMRDASDTEYAAIIANLSRGGCLLKVKGEPVTVGDRIRLAFKVVMEDIEHLVTAAGVVRSIVAAAPDSDEPTQAGVEFEELSGQDRLVITALVYQRLLDEHCEL